MTLALIIALAAITLGPALVAALASSLSPLLVALLTHLRAGAAVKRATGAIAATIIGFITSATTADGTATFTWRALLEAIVYAAAAYAIQQGTYTQVLRPRNLNSWKTMRPTHGAGRPPRPQR